MGLEFGTRPTCHVLKALGLSLPRLEQEHVNKRLDMGFIDFACIGAKTPLDQGYGDMVGLVDW